MEAALVLALLCTCTYCCERCEARDGAFVHSLAGPFDVNLDRVEVCPPSVNGLGLANYTTRLRRDRTDKRKFFYTGVISYFFDLTNSIGVRVSLSSWKTTGGWVENAFGHYFPNACALCRTFDYELFKKFVKKIFGVEHDCPFPAAEITFKDTLVFMTTGNKFSQFFYGKWRIDMQILSGDRTVLGCYRLFVETVPQLKRHHADDPTPADLGNITYRFVKPLYEERSSKLIV